MPEWWPEIEKICLEPSVHSGDFGSSLFPGNDSISGRLTNHSTSTLQLLGDHIIEREARNGQISVAGVLISLRHEIQDDDKPVFFQPLMLSAKSSGPKVNRLLSIKMASKG